MGNRHKTHENAQKELASDATVQTLVLATGKGKQN